MSENFNTLRIDLWLHRCRFFKTRSLATAAVKGGHVRLNGERATPGSRVKPGDRLDLTRDSLPYAVIVSGIPIRRGPAAEARDLYKEDEAIAAQRESQVRALKQDRLLSPRTQGRPDKHTRRQLIKRRRR